jgi:Na+/H+-dicarboxylate symporter
MLRGLDVMYTYGKLIGSFYLGLFILWAILIGVGYVFPGRRVGSLLKAVREPAMLASRRQAVRRHIRVLLSSWRNSVLTRKSSASRFRWATHSTSTVR